MRVCAALLPAVLAGCAAVPAEPMLATPSAYPRGASPLTERHSVGQRFASWVADFRAGASAGGIGKATLSEAFDVVVYLPEVVDRDRAQPEFRRTVWEYLDFAVSKQRVADGQDGLLQFQADIDAAAARYGVPAAVLVAIWA